MNTGHRLRGMASTWFKRIFTACPVVNGHAVFFLGDIGIVEHPLFFEDIGHKGNGVFIKSRPVITLQRHVGRFSSDHKGMVLPNLSHFHFHFGDVAWFTICDDGVDISRSFQM